MKPTWVIHAINEDACECCGKGDIKSFKEKNHPSPSVFPAFFNIHSHGLLEYGQRDICTSIDIGAREAALIINSIGLRVATDDHKPWESGIHTDILANGMPVEFIEFPDDPTLYLILPDEQGRLPEDGDINEDTCSFPYSRQKMYAKIIHDGKDYI